MYISHIFKGDGLLKEHEQHICMVYSPPAWYYIVFLKDGSVQCKEV